VKEELGGGEYLDFGKKLNRKAGSAAGEEMYQAILKARAKAPAVHSKIGRKNQEEATLGIEVQA